MPIKQIISQPSAPFAQDYPPRVPPLPTALAFGRRAGAELPTDGTLWSRTVRIAGITGPEGVLVALRVYQSGDQDYRAFLEWSDENDEPQLDDVFGQFDLVNGWQRITIGYRANDWIAAWVNGEVKRETDVSHADPSGTSIGVGKLNAVDDVTVNGRILFDDIDFQVRQVEDLWVDIETGDDGNTGESAEQALLTVRRSGNFTAELIGRVMRRARGHTDDLETLFARYNELEETGEISISDAPQTDPQAERVRQIADEFKQRAAEATDWAVSQLSLF